MGRKDEDERSSHVFIAPLGVATQLLVRPVLRRGGRVWAVLGRQADGTGEGRVPKGVRPVQHLHAASHEKGQRPQVARSAPFVTIFFFSSCTCSQAALRTR